MICRQLGYSRARMHYEGSPFDKGMMPSYHMSFNDLECDGDEESILDCVNDQDHDACSYDEGAGVECEEDFILPPYYGGQYYHG